MIERAPTAFQAHPLDALRTRLAALPPLWPSACAVCHRRGEPGVDFCRACRGHLPGLHVRDGRGDIVETLCGRCGRWWPGELPGAVCAPCAARSPPFARTVVPWRYDFPLDGLIRRMKYRDERVLARVFGTLLAREACRTDGLPETRADLPDLVLGVPSSRARREGGFDHAAALARWCAREIGLPDRSALAERIVDTGRLAGLSRAAREDRIRGAFRADPRVHGRRVAIVDDVLTSGATAGELARELYDTGAVSVELWVLARTPATG